MLSIFLMSVVLSASCITRSAALLLAAVLTACGPSPAAPRTALSFTGTWTGSLPIRTPAGDDWSDTRMTLGRTNDRVTGEIVNAAGARHTLSGTASGTSADLRVDGLPGTSTCAGVVLTVEITRHVRRGDRLAGQAGGRCFGTIAGTFALRRVE
jgi:hypothetical protein